MRIHWAVPVAALAALALGAGCSSAPGDAAPDGGDAGLSDGGDADGGPDGGNGGTAVPCLGSYSGAVTGAFECAVSATFDVGAGQTVFAMAATARTGDAFMLSLPFLVISGTLDAGTYGLGSAEIVQATSEVSAGDPDAGLDRYLARYGFPSSADLGDAGVTFSSVAPGAAEGDYDVHGSLGATLELDPAPDGGAAPPVSLQATF